MMKRLEVNFTARRRRPQWAGAVLMAVALALAGDAGWSYVHAERMLARAEMLVARARPATPPRPVPAEEVAAARETLASLALPWPKLFRALESAASEDVALLAVEPDPASGKVMISGDGKSYLAALAYVLNLSRADALSDVELVRHERSRNEGPEAVTFWVRAAWKGER